MNALESIRIHNGVIYHLDLHQQRMNRTCAQLWQSDAPLLSAHTPSDIPSKGSYKWRVTYDKKIQTTQLLPYIQQPIKTLQLIEDTHINYSNKLADRLDINRLFAQKQGTDDILITKNGYLTDTSYCNIILHRGGQLFTPSTPLLQGVQRQFLLDTQQIKACNLHIRDLHLYEHFQLINAMIPLEHAPIIPIANIQFC